MVYAKRVVLRSMDNHAIIAPAFAMPDKGYSPCLVSVPLSDCLPLKSGSGASLYHSQHRQIRMEMQKPTYQNGLIGITERDDLLAVFTWMNDVVKQDERCFRTRVRRAFGNNVDTIKWQWGVHKSNAGYHILLVFQGRRWISGRYWNNDNVAESMVWQFRASVHQQIAIIDKEVNGTI